MLDDAYQLTEGMPPERVGWLISHARIDAELSPRTLARQLGVETRTLKRWERGYTLPSDAHATAIAEHCGITVDDLLPPRHVVAVDLDAGTLSIGDRVVTLDLESAGNEGVLAQYLALVYESRNAVPGTYVHLRHDDIVVLASLLDLDDLELETRIVDVMGCTPEQAGAIKRRLLRHRNVARAAAVALGVLAVIPTAQLVFGRESHSSGGHGAGTTGGGSPSTQLVADVGPAAGATTVSLPPPAVLAAPATDDGAAKAQAPLPPPSSAATLPPPTAATFSAPLPPPAPTTTVVPPLHQVTVIEELPPDDTSAGDVQIGDAVTVVRPPDGAPTTTTVAP